MQEFEKLSEFIQKYYHATLTKRDMSLRGWNWGVADFVGEECTLFKIFDILVCHFLSVILQPFCESGNHVAVMELIPLQILNTEFCISNKF